MDQLTVPQALLLGRQIHRWPPINILITDILKKVFEQQSDKVSKLAQVSSKNVRSFSEARGPNVYMTKSGGRLKKLVVKKTGQALI